MANKSHVPFTAEKPELTAFLSKLHGYDYDGPITLELDHKTSMKEIAKSKAIFDKMLKDL
jgi:sugar phosphate isomerase/epimerase